MSSSLPEKSIYCVCSALREISVPQINVWHCLAKPCVVEQLTTMTEIFIHLIVMRGRGGSVVELQTLEQEVQGLNPTTAM